MKFTDDNRQTILIEVDDKTLDALLAYQEQEGFETVQDAILNAIRHTLDG